MKGLPIYPNATNDERIEYLFFKALYQANADGVLDRQTCTTLKKDFLFKRKCWDAAAQRYLKTASSIAQYHAGRSVENADKIIDALHGLED